MRGDSPIRAALIASLAAMFGWILGLVLPLIGPLFAAIVAALAAFGAEIAHRLEDRGLTGPGLRLTELGAAFIVAKVTHLALLGPGLAAELGQFPVGLADPETTIGFVLMWFVRNAAYKTARDVGLLGSPGDDLVGTAYDRLARRFRLLLGGSTLLAAFAVAGWSQLAVLDRSAVDGVVWPLALMLIVGVGSLGGFRRVEEQGRWRRAGARVHDGVLLRWGSGVVAITAGVALTALLFRWGVDEFARTPAAVVRGVALAGSALLRWIGVGESAPIDTSDVPIIQDNPSDATQDDGLFDFIQPEDEPGDMPGWGVALIVLAWLGMAMSLIGLLIVLLRNRRWIKGVFQLGPAEGLRAIVTEFFRMIAELGRLIWTMLTFWRSSPEATNEAEEGDELSSKGRRPPDWDPADARRTRIAAAYHRFLASARTMLPRHRTETPDEYATAIGGQLRFGQHEAERLTGIYVEARYSSHEMTDADIGTAEQLADDLDAILATGPDEDA